MERETAGKDGRVKAIATWACGQRHVGSGERNGGEEDNNMGP